MRHHEATNPKSSTPVRHRISVKPRPSRARARVRNGNRSSRAQAVAVVSRGEVQIIRPQGTRLFYPHLGSLVREVRHLVDLGARKLVIDLGAVNDIDGASIGGLVELYRLLRQKGGSIRLTAPRPWVRKMLEMTGIPRVVPVDRGVAEALVCLQSPRAIQS
jgi:anti-sigma B factor antagonist